MTINNQVAHMAYVPGLGKLVGATPISSNAIFEQRTETDAEAITGVFVPIHADYSYAINITAVNLTTSTLVGGEATITKNSGSWTIKAGDAIVYSGQSYIVRSVTNSTTCVVRPTVTATAQAATAYDGFPCLLEWQRLSATGGRGMFASVVFDFDNLRGVERLEYEPVNEHGIDAETTLMVTGGTMAETTPVPNQVRGMHPRAVARANVIRPILRITAALSPWRLTGMRADYNVHSSRVSR